MHPKTVSVAVFALLACLSFFAQAHGRPAEEPSPEWIEAWTPFASAPYDLDEEAERKIGPWLDLRTGGVATGPMQSTADGAQGALVDGTLLPAKGLGFRRVSGAEEAWGTGHMISLIENAAAFLTTQIWPGMTVAVGDIAMQFGGKYGPHKSHQNGLDADLLFIGNQSWKSVLDDKGQVTERFNPEMNWAFWRSMFDQKIVENGKTISVISMILVAPEIKNFLCTWGTKNGVFKNADDLEMMKRIRPTEGHDDHMHIRLRCSPHHPLCRREGIASDLGCPASP